MFQQGAEIRCQAQFVREPRSNKGNRKGIEYDNNDSLEYVDIYNFYALFVTRQCLLILEYLCFDIN